MIVVKMNSHPKNISVNNKNLMSNKPLSEKGAKLLAQLKANVTQTQKSQYVQSLVETAAKRKLASELAMERKLAREDEANGLEELTVFVTKDYTDQVEATQRLLGQEHAGDRFTKGEQINASENETYRAPLRNNTVAIDAAALAEELKQKRLQKRLSRLAPQSRVNEQMISEARARAEKRLLHM